MLRRILEKSYYVFEEEFNDWRDSIKASYAPLLKDNIVNESYIESVIACIEEYGPYIVILPNVAMPHSSVKSNGCNGTEISFMKVRKPVKFDEEDREKDATIFFSLAADDCEKHIKNIQSLMEFLENENLVQELIKVENEYMFKELVKKYS